MGEVFMNDHEAAEIRRLPLDSVVLELKNMMGDRPVVPVLEVFTPSILSLFFYVFVFVDVGAVPLINQVIRKLHLKIDGLCKVIVLLTSPIRWPTTYPRSFVQR